MAYMKREGKDPLEYRHLAGVKVQPNKRIKSWDPFDALMVPKAWTEINVMRGCVHPNIVAYYEHFAVEAPDKGVGMSIVMLIEYASAGDLKREVARYYPHAVPESGARYYVKQVMRGLAYLHRKHVLHNDLHAGNVLLRYNSDCSKTAMLGDFGSATVYDPLGVKEGRVTFNTRRDVRRIVGIIAAMIMPLWVDVEPDDLSQEVMVIMLAAEHQVDKFPATVDQLALLMIN